MKNLADFKDITRAGILGFNWWFLKTSSGLKQLNTVIFTSLIFDAIVTPPSFLKPLLLRLLFPV
jgi:hypothetical protein